MNMTFDTNQLWNAVCDRDACADGSFVFGVRTTGVYCRPSCPARRPNRENVSFFDGPQEAERAGYRACLRCQAREPLAPGPRLVQQVRELLDAEPDEQPSLTELASRFLVSPGHLQRTFRRYTGLSPRDYQESRRLSSFKQGLQNGSDVTSAVFDAGYSGSSRVYEKSDDLLGMTPGTYGRRGSGLVIGFACRRTRLGVLLLAATDRGVCFVALTDTPQEAEAALRREFSNASIQPAEGGLEDRLDAVEALIEGRSFTSTPALDLRGTAFQILVWKALRNIPTGQTRTYGQVAREIGRPGAMRAVGSACAANPVAVLVPCHRVVPAGSSGGGYRWGLKRKQALLASEAQQRP